MVSEAKSLTEDEYLHLGELFNQFKKSQDGDSKAMIIGDLDPYIERFPDDSMVLFYYKNWSKTTTVSDSYMSLISNLGYLTENVYGKNSFKNLF
jgi:hypothetical protein